MKAKRKIECVANKIINGEQSTIYWYMENTKISHKDTKVADQDIKEIKERFGNMVVTIGKKHTYLV